jgi:hypothetical protein
LQTRRKNLLSEKQVIRQKNSHDEHKQLNNFLGSSRTNWNQSQATKSEALVHCSIEHSASGAISIQNHASALAASGHSLVGSTLDCASSATNSYAASTNYIDMSGISQHEDEQHVAGSSLTSNGNICHHVYDEEQDERLNSILEATEVWYSFIHIPFFLA